MKEITLFGNADEQLAFTELSRAHGADDVETDAIFPTTTWTWTWTTTWWTTWF